MKTEEDEAFEAIERRQGGFLAKRAMAADKQREDRINYGTSWEKDGERIDPMSVYKEPVTEREALKLALEALDLSQALLEKSSHHTKILDAYIAIKEALAQPAQEPVARVTGVYGGRFTYAPLNPAMVLPVGMALYSTPQHTATWVGLTDEEIDVIYEQHHNQYGECESPNFGYERAIEAKLKEKNT